MASRVVTSLVAAVRANTSGFQKSMKAAGSSLSTFGDKLGFLKSKALGFGAALSGIVAGGGIALMVKQSFSAIDALAKVSAKLGIATDDLAALQHAANLTGNSTQNLNLGLQRMTRRIAEAATGSGEAKNALAELGLDAVALSRMSPDKQFSAIADAMEKVGSQSDRVRLGFKLFDAEGVGLINTLKGGSTELAKLTNEARRFGVAVSAIDARKIEAANDSMFRLRQAFRGIANRIAVAIAPVVSVVADKIADWASNSNVVNAIMGAVNTTIDFTIDLIDLVIVSWKTFRLSISETAFFLRKVERQLHRIGVPGFGVDMVNALNEARTEVHLLTKDLNKFLAGGSLKDMVDRLRREIERQSKKPLEIPMVPKFNPEDQEMTPVAQLAHAIERTRIGMAAIINPNLIGLSGAARQAVQPVRDPQLKETNVLLEAIRKLLGKVGIVT